MCDLDNLLCQGLVQDSENYELESRGVSGNYDPDVPQVSVSCRDADSIHCVLAFHRSTRFYLELVDGYRIPFISTPPPHHSKNNSSALEEEGFVAEAISELLCENRDKEENSTS